MAPTDATTTPTPPAVESETRLARWLVRSRLGLLLVAAATTLAAWYPSTQLRLDESIESFFAESDPHLLAYRRSKQTFGGDEFVMVGYISNDPLAEEERRKLQQFAQRLSAVPGVRRESTQDLATALRNPRAKGILKLAQRLPTTEQAIIRLSRRVLIGDDGRTVAVVLRLVPESEAPVTRHVTFERIRRIVSEFDRPAYVAGEPLQVYDMFRYVEQDGWVLGTASTILLLLVILAMFRSVRWMVLPLLVVHVTLIWTCGVLFLSGIKLSMVSSMLTSLVTIIGIATVTHVTITFRELRREMDREGAFCGTFARLWGPVLGTCLTTAIGFLALLVSGIVPVRSFGIMMALGTLLVPLACLGVLPAGILLGGRDIDPGSVPAEGRLVEGLRRLAEWTGRHSRLIVAAVLVLGGMALSGLPYLKVETDFSKNFREQSPIVQSLRFFESHLGGVGSWDVSFDAPHQLSEEYLDRVRALADDLRNLTLPDGTQLTKVVPLTDGLDLLPRIPVDDPQRKGLIGMLTRLQVPTLDQKMELVANLQPEMIPSLYNPAAGRMRIVLRALEQQPAEVKLRLIGEVERVARRHFPEAQASGLYVLLANLISSLLSDQLASFLLAATGIALAMTIGFASFRIGLISLVPNALPIVLLIGMMGWLGITVNIGTAMIASVSMGLTVDSTIHYLTHYRRLRSAGASHGEAIAAAHAGVGRALVLANVALVCGFTVLSLSNFIPLVYFGVLVSVAMLGGLAGNLFVLPVLAGFADRSRAQQINEPVWGREETRSAP